MAEQNRPVGDGKKKQKAPAVEGGTRCGTVALVGRANVGKSTIMNAILGQKIAPTTHKPQTTRRRLRGVETRGDTQVVFVDTPGLHQARGGLHAFMVEEALAAARDVDVIAFVIEARGEGIAAEDLEALGQLKRAGVENTPMILVINKVDKVLDKKLLLPLMQAWGGDERFFAIVPVSATKKSNLDVLVDELVKKMPAGEHIFAPDAITDAAEKDIAAELIREKVMLELGDELPYRVAVVVEDFDEERRGDETKPLVHISAVLHVERDSQKSIVIGKAGSRIKVIGQRARMELQRLVGCQVMLELVVRVEPNWTTDVRRMRKLGYA